MTIGGRCYCFSARQRHPPVPPAPPKRLGGVQARVQRGESDAAFCFAGQWPYPVDIYSRFYCGNRMFLYKQTVQHFFVVMSATLQKKKGGGVELPAACALAAQPTTSFAVAGAPQAVGEGFSNRQLCGHTTGGTSQLRILITLS